MTDTRTIIIEAATRTFAKHGARKTAMVDIAEAAGVSRQTLYALFGNKDDLVAATITHHAQQNFALVEEGVEGLQFTPGGVRCLLRADNREVILNSSKGPKTSKIL